ncbi:peptidoglycan-binding domain-containing protein [Streptomyces mesophilus]|uniref:peptidoglycan-binding domain-containing protein n=1 Tax=Streptomyces mesophilus TaxID=1775132 RepID=UPI00331D0A12
MNLRSTPAKITTGVIGMLAAGALAVSTAPASANADDGYVRGYDAAKGDWGDEGTLGSHPGLHQESNATCLWQKILWAEGAYYPGPNNTHPRFTASQVTGYFGWYTDRATVTLQARWGLDKDGVVGPATFSRAERQLTVTGGSDDRGEQLNFTYYGQAHSFSVIRNKEGQYAFRDGDDKWRAAGYNYRTCS